MEGILRGKKVLMLHSTSDLYGASRIFFQTAVILKDHGAEAHVILSEPGSLSEELKTSGFAISYLRLGILRRKYFNPVGIVNRTFYLVKSVLFIKKLIRQKKIDLVYSNTTGVFAGIFAARLTGTPHVWHIHEIIERPSMFSSITAAMMRSRSDLNIFVSDATLDHWTSIDPRIAHLNKAIRIYNGLTIAESLEDQESAKLESRDLLGLSIPEEVTVVGMIGRINPWKGQMYFLEIAKQLIVKNKSVHFLMAGDPYPGYEGIRDEIRKKIKEFGLGGCVTDLGYQKDNTNFFKTIDILVVPSTLPDPLPTVVLEAMSYSKPVVGTALGGIVEMISDGVTGYLMQPDDATESAGILSRLIDDSSLRQQMGASGLEVVKTRFSPERFKSLILEAVKRAVDGDS